MKRRKESLDFSKGRRGAVIAVPPGKTRITIRIDSDLLEWFREQVNSAGGGNYQTLMNQALRSHVEAREKGLEDLLRRVLREELPRAARDLEEAAIAYYEGATVADRRENAAIAPASVRAARRLAGDRVAAKGRRHRRKR